MSGKPVLPPGYYAALKPHIQRVNHRAALYKRAHEQIPEKPKPYEDKQGWTKTSDGIVEPIWSDGPILPTSLVDLLDKTDYEDTDSSEEEESDEMDVDFGDSDDE